MKYIVLYIVILITINVAFAQDIVTRANDSILKKLTHTYQLAENDSVKFLSLIKLSRYEAQRGFKETLPHLDEALSIYNTQKYTLDSMYLGDIYRFYGTINSRHGNISESLKFNLKAKDIYTRLDKKVRIAVIDNNISILYNLAGDYRKSIVYGKSAIKINSEAKKIKSLGLLRNLGFYHNNIGRSFLALKKMDSAMYHFATAKDYFSKTDYEIGWYRANSNIAEIFESQGKLTQSLSIYLEKLEHQIDGDYRQGIVDTYLNISRVHMKLKAYTKALVYSKKAIALAKEENFISLLAKAYLQKAEMLKAMNRYKEAYKNISLYHIYNDSLVNIDNVKKIQEIELTYNFRKEKVKDSLQLVKEREIAETNTELLKKESKIKSQWMLFGGIGLLAVFIILYLLRSNTFAKKQQELQTQFSQDLINGQEQERAHLARELHDSVGQKLMLLSKQTKNIGNTNMQHLASATLEDVREISRGLHPSNLERLGLTEAINALIYDINANTDLFFTENIENVDNILSKESELHLYRIIQESLSNIVKHAEAKAVKFTIQKEENTVDISISDNGKGFDIASKRNNMSLGIKTLFERAKIINTHIDLQSNLGKGTMLTLSIPIKNG